MWSSKMSRNMKQTIICSKCECCRLSPSWSPASERKKPWNFYSFPVYACMQAQGRWNWLYKLIIALRYRPQGLFIYCFNVAITLVIPWGEGVSGVTPSFGRINYKKGLGRPGWNKKEEKMLPSAWENPWEIGVNFFFKSGFSSAILMWCDQAKSVGSRKYWFWDIAKQRKYSLLFPFVLETL